MASRRASRCEVVREVYGGRREGDLHARAEKRLDWAQDAAFRQVWRNCLVEADESADVADLRRKDILFDGVDIRSGNDFLDDGPPVLLQVV